MDAEHAGRPAHAPADADPRSRAERERLQRRFAHAGGSAASRRLFELLLAYRLTRVQDREARA